MEKQQSRQLLQKAFQILLPEKSDVFVVIIYGVALGLLSLSVPLAVQALVNSIAFAGLLQPIFVLIALLTFAVIGSVIFQSLQYIVIETLQQRIFVRITSKLSESIPRFKIKALNHTQPSEMLNRYFDVFLTQKSIASLLLHGVDASLIAFSGMIVLAFYHPALFAFDLVLIVSVGCVFLIPGKKGRDTSVEESKSKYAIAAWFEEISKAPLSTKNPWVRKALQVQTQQLGTDYLNKRKAHFRVVFKQLVSVLAIEALASVSLLAIGGTLVIQKQLSIGQLVASELIVTAVVASIAKLGSKIETFYDLLASVEKIDELFHIPIEKEHDIPNSLWIAKEPGCVSFQNLKIYDKTVPFTGTIEQGTWVLLTDQQSSSSLLESIFGSYEPKSGFIMLEGHDIRDLPLDTIRKRVCLIRKAELFPLSIKKNLTVAQPSLTTPEVWNILCSVGLEEKVRRLPHGLETTCAEFTKRYGLPEQFQLTFARALAFQTPIVLIDQAFEWLPEDVQQTLYQALVKGHNPTVFLSARSERVKGLCSIKLPVFWNTDQEQQDLTELPSTFSLNSDEATYD